MPNLDTIAAQDWLKALQPGQSLPDWPPPIRALEEPPLHARALIDLGDELGFLDGIEALQDLRQTTFRAEKTLLDYFEAKLKSRPR